MSHKRTEIRKAIARKLEQLGVEAYVFEVTRGCHQRVTFLIGGLKCQYVFAATASDHRSTLNSVAGVARVVREARGRSARRAGADSSSRPSGADASGCSSPVPS